MLLIMTIVLFACEQHVYFTWWPVIFFIFAVVQLKIKVQTLLENQGEILHLLRRMSANSLDGGEPVDIEDLIPQPLRTKHELQELCDKLEQDDTYRGKMVTILVNGKSIHYK